MRQLTIAGRTITDESPPYIIAELGANHMGDFQVCRRMIEEAVRCGADAIKLQKRDNRALFTKAAYDAPYNSENAYAPTYGAHRDYLEFGEYEFQQVRQMCDAAGIAFICTPFEEKSADFVYHAGVDAFKVASSHLKDTPLMSKLARFGKPIIISAGGGRLSDIQRADYYLSGMDASYAFLHCTSLYPTKDDDLHLDVIPELRRVFPDVIIGFSSHHPGIEPNIIAAILGARIIEVHFTLNRGYPGTDHGFSFEPQGLRKLVEDTKRISVMRGNSFKLPLDAEKAGFVYKQGRALHPIKPIRMGEVIGLDNVGLKAPAKGPPPYEMDRYLGKIAVCDLSTADTLTPECVEPIRPMGDL